MMSNYQVTLIKLDGSQLTITPQEGNQFTLKEMQHYVGGYIEIVYLQNNLIMVINEEGRLLGLPRNEKATKLANFHLDFDDYIAGDVVICSNNQVD